MLKDLGLLRLGKRRGRKAYQFPSNVLEAAVKKTVTAFSNLLGM